MPMPWVKGGWPRFWVKVWVRVVGRLWVGRISGFGIRSVGRVVNKVVKSDGRVMGRESKWVRFWCFSLGCLRFWVIKI